MRDFPHGVDVLEQIRSQDYLDENFTIDLSKIDLSGSQKAPLPWSNPAHALSTGWGTI